MSKKEIAKPKLTKKSSIDSAVADLEDKYSSDEEAEKRVSTPILEADSEDENEESGVGVSIQHQIAEEIIDDVRSPQGFYDSQAVNQILRSYSENNPDVFLIEIEGVNYLTDRLQEFADSDKPQALVPLHVNGNHFAGLHIVRDGNNFNVVYFDPAGNGEIPENVAEILEEVLDIDIEDIVVTIDQIQHHSLQEEVLIYSNNHCGAFVSLILPALAEGSITVEDSHLIFNYYNDEPRALGNLTETDSNELGIFLRSIHANLLENGDEDFLKNSLIHLKNIELKKLEREIKKEVKLTRKNSQYKVTSNQEEYLEGKKVKKEKLRHTSTAVEIIEIGDSVRSTLSDKGSGFDENFKTSEAHKYIEYDKKLGLEKKSVSFSNAHVRHRVRTHSYVHRGIGNEINKVNGHPGGVFKDEESMDADKGHKTSGSKSFHERRHSEIDKVLKDKNIANQRKPAEATKRVLKFLVDDTLGYKDLKSKDLEFQRYTASGHDLSDPKQREYVFKAYQAYRDSRKLGVVAFDRSTDFTDKEAVENSVEELFSPIRAVSPFSNAVFGNLLEEFSKVKLEEDQGFEEIADIIAKPIPIPRPAGRALRDANLVIINPVATSTPKKKSAKDEGVEEKKEDENNPTHSPELRSKSQLKENPKDKGRK